MSQNQKPKNKKKRRRYRLVIPKAAPKSNTTNKKRPFRIKFDVLVLFAAVLLILLIGYLPYRKEIKAFEALGWNKEEITKLKEEKLDDLVLEKGWYSPFLASALMDDTLNRDYIELYTVMPEGSELNGQSFLLIKRLEEKGYEEDQILNLIPKLYEWELTPLLVFDYQYNETLYIEDCINNRDVNSTKHFELNGNYYTPYDKALPVDDANANSKLVNKTYYLDASYVPPHLTEVTGYYTVPGLELTAEAAEALNEWGEAGRLANITFYATSGYRSYDDQSWLYTVYTAQMGQEEADSLSARAGFSEHQTGLTVDIAASNEDDVEEYKDTNAYQWTSTNSQDYGWILRYPKDKEEITGYQFESWHYRYLGVELAKQVTASELTYDEYYCLYLKPWDYKENVPSEDILNAAKYPVSRSWLYESAAEETE